MIRTAAVLALLWWAGPAHADEAWVLVQDDGCAGCRAEVFQDGKLVVLLPAGERPRVAPLAPLRSDGSSELRIFVRGPEGGGTMSIHVGSAHLDHGVVIFDGAPRRYALSATPQPDPVRLPLTPTR